MDHYTMTLARELARQNGTRLLERHWQLLDYAESYYARHGVGPLYGNLSRELGATRQEIEALFPHGLASLYVWAGLPVHTPEAPCKAIPRIAVAHPRTVYLDHSATTPVRPEVAAHMVRYNASATAFANASSGSPWGKEAHRQIEEARSRVAKTLQVRPECIVFTGGGSEANNLAIKGLVLPHLKEKGHLITSAVAHASVLEPMRWLEQIGFDLTVLLPDGQGRITAEAVSDALRPDTRLVALLLANNEIGTVNPMAEIGTVCRRAGVPLHVDAVQAYVHLALDPAALGATTLSLSGHKFYGPKGVGALYVAPGTALVPLIHGGGQESGLRAGTENVAAIGGMGLAAKLLAREREAQSRRLRNLQRRLWEGIRRVEPEVRLNGSVDQRLPHHLSLSFPGVTSGSLLLALAQIGITVSAGSACSAGKEEGSHVLRALGVDGTRFGTIRVTLGRSTQEEDIDYFLKYIPTVLQALRTGTEVTA